MRVLILAGSEKLVSYRPQKLKTVRTRSVNDTHICVARGLRGFDDPYARYRPSKGMSVRIRSVNKKKLSGLSIRTYASFLKRLRKSH